MGVTFTEKKDFLKHLDEELGESDWFTVDQGRINGFADATGDHQWIHVNPEMAKQGPFGTTIAHGFLTLSLAPALIKDIVATEGAKMGINYGLNRVRFTNPVQSGKRVRMKVKLTSAEEVEPNGVQCVYGLTFEIEGEEKPACVAEWITRTYF